MRRNPLRLALVFALALVACGDGPPGADPEPGHDYNSQPLPAPMRDRTLKQGERP